VIKKSVLVTLLILFGLIVICLYGLLLSQEGLKLSIRAVDRFIPGQLSVDSVQGSLANSFILKGLHFSDGINIVSIDRLSFSWHPVSLLQKELDIRSFEVKGAHLAFPAADTDDSISDEGTSFPSFTLPLSIKVKHLFVDSLVVKTTDDTPPFQLATLVVENFSGKESLIQIGNCEVTSDSFQIVVNGQLQTGDIYSTTLNVDYSVNSDGIPPIQGNGVLDGSFDELGYEAHFLAPFIGSVKGTVSDLSGTLRWKGDLLADKIDLLNLNKDWPQFVFSEFKASGEGSLATYTLQAKTSAAYDSFQDIIVSVDLKGDTSGMQITEARINHKETELKGKGQLGWKDVFTWQAELTGRQINPELYDPQWPGRLSFEAYTSGQLRDGEVKADVDLVELDGELRGFPVFAKGKIEIDGNEFAVDTLSIQSSDSSLQAFGKVADLIDIDFKMESSELNTVWPGLSGSMAAAGRLSGSRAQPEFQFDMSGDNIALDKTKVTGLIASGTGELTPQGSISVSIAATEVIVAETMLDTVAVDIKGTLQDHVLKARVKAPTASAVFKFQGGYADERWKGHVSSGEIQTDRIRNWQLQKPVPIVLSTNNAEIGKFCLAGSQAALICLDGKYEQTGDWSAHAEITSLSVDLFKDMQSKFKELGGLLSGTATLKGQGAEIAEGGLDLSTDNLSVKFDFSDDYSREVVWQKNTIHAAFKGDTADVKINSILQDGSSMTAEALLRDIVLLPFSIEKTGVQGKIHLNVLDLQPLSAISLPSIDPYGTLKGELEFSGNLMRPDFFGYVQLENGKMILPALGITIKEMEVNVDGKDDRLLLTVNATSGDGTLHGESVLSMVALEENPSVELNITGEDFEIINLQEARIKISPDLKVMISKQQGEVNGDILITEANISLQNVSGLVSPSKDVVIVGDGLEEEKIPWPFYANVTIKAGENTRVNAFGLKGRMEGQLQIVEDPTKPVIGEGNLEVKEGTFSIYGRQLKIVKGGLLYSGSPLDNPGIEVRAENTAGGVTTGIEVSGFLSEPDISFYSTPTMEENEIIKRLLMNTSLVGSSDEKGFVGSVTSDTGMDTITSAVQNIKEGLNVDDVKIETGEESEDLSLVIGTWLTPKLYISYGKNLLNESGSFHTHYVLGHGFSVETESGTTASGFDLMYEIDK
jgi:translocation and assembly module TamB